MAKNQNLLGKWAFLIGLVVALLAGLLEGFYTLPYLAFILVVLGLVVGFINIAEKNTVKLLVAILVLMAAGSMTVLAIPAISGYLQAMLFNFVLFVGAAGFVVAIKAILETSKL